MSLRIGNFISEEHDGYRTGYVFYDSVTMYMYPVIVEKMETALEFERWVEETYGKPINGIDDDLYAVYEGWVKSSEARNS